MNEEEKPGRIRATPIPSELRTTQAAADRKRVRRDLEVPDPEDHEAEKAVARATLKATPNETEGPGEE